MTIKKEKLIRTTVQLSPHQHRALENLKSPGKSISAIVRTALDEYLEPYYDIYKPEGHVCSYWREPTDEEIVDDEKQAVADGRLNEKFARYN